MFYYDDRDYYDADNIDELYDDDEYVFDDHDDDDTTQAWEYDYHNLTDEISED